MLFLVFYLHMKATRHWLLHWFTFRNDKKFPSLWIFCHREYLKYLKEAKIFKCYLTAFSKKPIQDRCSFSSALIGLSYPEERTHVSAQWTAQFNSVSGQFIYIASIHSKTFQGTLQTSQFDSITHTFKLNLIVINFSLLFKLG